MFGTGLQLAYNFLGGPTGQEWKDLGSSYSGGEGIMAALKNPDMYQDAARFLGNSAISNAKFIADSGLDILQMPFNDIEYDKDGVPIRMKPFFTIKFKYEKDAMLSDKFGTPTIYSDNPYAKINKKETQKMFDKAQSEYDSFVKPLMTKELDDRLNEEAIDDYGWSDYIKDNPRGSLNEYYDDLDKRHEKKLFSYQKEKAGDLFDNSIENQFKAKFGIRDNQPTMWDSFETSFDTEKLPAKGEREEYENYTPFFKYETPRADILKRAGSIGEIATVFGALPAARRIIPKYFKNAAKSNQNWKQRFDRSGEGIMSNRKQIEGPNKISPDLASRLYNRVDRSAQRRSRRR